MIRRGVNLPSYLSVDEIITVYRVDFSKRKPNTDVESHDFPEIIYVTEGNHNLLLNSKPFELKKGQMAIYAPLALHATYKPSKAKVLIISFKTAWTDINEICNRAITLSESEKDILADLMEKCFISLTFGKNEERDEIQLKPKDDIGEYELIEIKKQLELFLASVAKNEKNCSPHHRDSFNSVARFLKENVYSDFTLSQIAEKNSMSVSKLKILFRENTGSGAINYHLNLKIEKAKQMLFEDKYNITQISDKLGFNSIHYFSRLFKAKVGVSPTDYAKNNHLQ